MSPRHLPSPRHVTRYASRRLLFSLRYDVIDYAFDDAISPLLLMPLPALSRHFDAALSLMLLPPYAITRAACH